jgi:hypothetical protein
MTTSTPHHLIIQEVRKTIAPQFRFLFRCDFYEAFFAEIVTKTLKAIERENEINLTPFEKLIYDK